MPNNYPLCPVCQTRHKQCPPSNVENMGLDYIEVPRQDKIKGDYMSNIPTVAVPIRKVAFEDPTNLWFVFEQEADGAYKQVSKGYQYQTSALAKLGRLVLEDTKDAEDEEEIPAGDKE